MNKLEEYKHNSVVTGQAPESFNEQEVGAYCEGLSDGFDKGFDRAIALDLPVKFTTWTRHNSVMSSDEGIYLTDEKAILHFGYFVVNEKELYQYWIDNIYKPE